MVELLSFEKYVNGRCDKPVTTHLLSALVSKQHWAAPVELMVERVPLASELKRFKENIGGSPSYTINMCFGEMFPDGKPLEKKLIVVQVTSFSLFPELDLYDCWLVFFFGSHWRIIKDRSLTSARAGGSSDLPSLPRDGPAGGCFFSPQRQHQPPDLTQQPVRPHQLRVWPADGRGGSAGSSAAPSSPRACDGNLSRTFHWKAVLNGRDFGHVQLVSWNNKEHSTSYCKQSFLHVFSDTKY